MRPDQENNHLHLAAIHSGKLNFLSEKGPGLEGDRFTGKPFQLNMRYGVCRYYPPFPAKGKIPVLLCPGNGTVIPPGDDRIDFPSSYRERGPAAQQPRFRTTRKLPPPFLLPPLLQHLPHVSRTCSKYQTGTNVPRTIPPANCQPGRQKEEQTTTSPPGTSHGTFSSTRQKIEGQSATPATTPRTGR